MDSLNKNGFYELKEDELKELRADFDADFSSDDEVKQFIKDYALNKHYLMDPHTATTIKLFKKYKNSKNIAYSTAEWTKFAPTVLNALKGDNKKYSDLEALVEVAKITNVLIPVVIEELFNKPIVHDTVIAKTQIEEEILKFLDR